MRKFLFILLILCPTGLRAEESQPRRVAHGTKGMVVCAHPLAGKAGLAILSAGGNAVDAAVATGMALAVVHPSAGNIGGGGFLLMRTARGDAHAIDFREKAPLAAISSMFLDSKGAISGNSNHEGFLAIGVPGTVAGFDLALRKLGTKSWQDVTQAAIHLAANGFPLTPAMAQEFSSRIAEWKKYPASARSFLKPDGSAYAGGEVWRQPHLAATLRRIATEGAKGFYDGVTARTLAADMKAHGGLITEADLAAYQARERSAVQGTYRGYNIISMPPPSSGGVTLVEMLNILEGFDLKAAGHHSADHLHFTVEAMRRGYADRAKFLGDPDFNPELPLKTLLAKDHAEKLRRSIHPDHATASDPAKFAEAYESPETTHFSVIDAEGNAVVVTYTLEDSYGTKIVADGLGFLYNNEMGDFNPRPGITDTSGLIGTPPNLVAPQKRMLSSMTPTIIVREGKAQYLLGSPGGRTIINTVLQVTVNLIDFQMSLEDAVAAGRIHHQWLPNEVKVEPNAASPETLAELRRRGHIVREGSRQGRVMAIAIDPRTGIRTGVADSRDPDGAAVAQP